MKRAVAVAAGGALALAVSAVAASARDDGPDNAKRISDALAGSMGSVQRSFTVPAAAVLGRTVRPGRLDAIPAAIKGVPSRAELEAQRVRGRADLARFTTGAALDKNVGTMDRWIGAQLNGTDDPNFRPLGGGVSAVRLTSVTVRGAAADVSAEVDEWAAMAQLSEDGSAEISRPTSTALVKAHLVQHNGRWLVDDYTWEFAPGSGP